MIKSEKHHVLYVDDEEHNLTSFKAAFRPFYQVHTALSAREGFKILREHPIEVIVTDQRMPEMTGVQFLEAVIPEYPDAIRMVLTGFSDVEAIIKAINSGRVYRYITKPWDENELKMTIDGAIEFFNLQRRNRELLHELQEKVTEQERIMKLFERYVPEHVVRETLASIDGTSVFDGECRIVSVLFVDIRNFTPLCSRLEPKEVVGLLNEFFAMLTTSVKRHRGTVIKFIGDGMLAVFGAPLSYLENQENAVNCALEIRERMRGFSDRYEPSTGEPLHIGIGINTGEVVVGNVGSEDRVEYTAIGDTVNIGARIESLTRQKPDSVLISESTYRLIGDAFEVTAWEPVAVKGKDEPIIVYEVIAAR